MCPAFVANNIPVILLGQKEILISFQVHNLHISMVVYHQYIILLYNPSCSYRRRNLIFWHWPTQTYTIKEGTFSSKNEKNSTKKDTFTNLILQSFVYLLRGSGTPPLKRPFDVQPFRTPACSKGWWTHAHPSSSSPGLGIDEQKTKRFGPRPPVF